MTGRQESFMEIIKVVRVKGCERTVIFSSEKFYREAPVQDLDYSKWERN